MDIAYYISDLLGQQGELTVPNLGYFVQIRKAAYYDSYEKKFFPPHNSVQFDPQTIDEDDSLANYITGVKNISLASAKYFIEKYIANLKSQAVVEDVPFAQLGAFSSDGLKLTFTSTPKMDDPAFFAFKPLDAHRIGEAPLKKHLQKPEIAAPTISQQPITPVASPTAPETVLTTPVTTAPEEPVEEYYEDEPKRGMAVWLIVLIAVVAVLAIAAGTLYKLRPDLVSKYLPIHKTADTDTIAATKTVITHQDVLVDTTGSDSAATQTPVQDNVKADTTTITVKKQDGKKPEVIKETTKAETKPVDTKKPEVKPVEVKKIETKKQAPPVVVQQPVATPPVSTPAVTAAPGDAVSKGMWVIYSGTFAIKSLANKRIEYLKGLGFNQARLAKEKVGPGANYKVILGAYKTHAEANDARKELLTTNKLKPADLSVDQY